MYRFWKYAPREQGVTSARRRTDQVPAPKKAEPGGNYPPGAARGPFGQPPPFGQRPPLDQGYGPQGQYHGYPPTAQVSPPPYGQPGLDQASPGFQQQAYSPQGYPSQGYPSQGYPSQGYPPQGYPPQGYPPQGYPPQGYPPQGPAPSPGLGEAACCGSCAACLTMLLCSCCNALMGGGMPDEGGMPPHDAGAPNESSPVAPPVAQADDDDL